MDIIIIIIIKTTCYGATQPVLSSSLTEVATPLLELTCHMGSHSVTCHPAEVTFQPLPQPKPVLDLATPEAAEGCKAELTLLAMVTYRGGELYPPKDGHPSK